MRCYDDTWEISSSIIECSVSSKFDSGATCFVLQVRCEVLCLSFLLTEICWSVQMYSSSVRFVWLRHYPVIKFKEFWNCLSCPDSGQKVIFWWRHVWRRWNIDHREFLPSMSLHKIVVPEADTMLLHVALISVQSSALCINPEIGQ